MESFLVAEVGFEPHDLRVMSPTSYQAALLRDIEFFRLYRYGAGDRGRTGTILSYHGILSPGRLPIPPHRQVVPRLICSLSVSVNYYITSILVCQPVYENYSRFLSLLFYLFPFSSIWGCNFSLLQPLFAIYPLLSPLPPRTISQRLCRY